MIDYNLIFVLILVFVGLFIFFLWIGNFRDRDENVISVKSEELQKINETQDYLFFGSEDKKQLYEKLIKSGATEAEALKFIS